MSKKDRDELGEIVNDYTALERRGVGNNHEFWVLECEPIVDKILDWHNKKLREAEREMLGLTETDRYELLNKSQIKTLINYHKRCLASLQKEREGHDL